MNTTTDTSPHRYTKVVVGVFALLFTVFALLTFIALLQREWSTGIGRLGVSLISLAIALNPSIVFQLPRSPSPPAPATKRQRRSTDWMVLAGFSCFVVKVVLWLFAQSAR